MRAIFAILILLALSGCASVPDFSGSFEGGDNTSLTIKHKRVKDNSTTLVEP